MPDLVFPEKEFNQLSRDERFLRRLKNIVETNLGDEQFGVEDVAEALAMSRTQVYRRLHKITGKNINQYIRETRLERALELLKKDVANVAEIAYQVGFGSPAYFNKCFHDHYGFPPGEIIKKYQEEGKFPDLIPAKMRDEKKYILFGKKKIIRRDRFMLYMVFILLLFGFITIGISYLFKIYNADLQSNLNKKETLVVFPIRNDDSYQQDDYLLASIQEEILKRLQKIERLRVYSSQPVGQSENNQENLSSILEELDVSYRLESSGRLYSDSLHLHTILMDSRTNIQIWEET